MSARSFSTDWVSGHAPAWRELLAHLVGVPGATMAEIGSFEGRSACWFADEVLTGDGAHLYCIDPWGWPGSLELFDANTAEEQRAGRIVTVRGTSEVLELLPSLQLDAIYIDGDHQAESVLTDVVRAWPHLKPGAVLIFDDYAHPDYAVRLGVESFLGHAGAGAEVIARGWQLAARKLADVAPLPVCRLHGLVHQGGLVCG